MGSLKKKVIGKVFKKALAKNTKKSPLKVKAPTTRSPSVSGDQKVFLPKQKHLLVTVAPACFGGIIWWWGVYF